MEVETIIQAFYEGKLQRTMDFENALKEISKEELIQFIINCQCGRCFKNIETQANYNKEFIDKFGSIEE